MTRKLTPLLIVYCFTSVLFISTNLAFAKSEWVYVAKVLDDADKGIIVRRNGDAYVIEKGVGCISFWRYENKTVLISSPGLFLGVGSTLILPEKGQQCRIWDSAELESLSTTQIPAQPKSQSLPKQLSNCESGHWISDITDGGEIIVLEDGSIWQVDSIDTIDSGLWLSTEEITICDDVMINTDNGEKVGVTRLK
jgi:hypothetical protein